MDERFDRAARRRAADLVVAPDEEAEERLDRLVEEGGYFVTTGQQPGLFSGPLYTVYKALSAVGRARQLERLLERPVVPLFWIASEDHDWEEVDHAWLVDVENELRKVAVPNSPGAGSRPLHRIGLDDDVEGARARFRDHLPETDFSERYLRILDEAYRPGVTLSDAFRHLLRRLFGGFGLCLVDAHHAGLKRASLPLLLAELEGAARHEELLRDDAGALRGDGYHVQVPILENGVNLFLEGPEGRERLYRDGDGGFRLRHSGIRLEREEIAERAEADPLVLSPNVLLRPVVERAVFPTICYVAGPGETSYFAQLQRLFASHGVGMPVVAPRRSITVLEAKNRKVLEKFDLTLEELDRPFHELASEVAREEVPPDVRRSLGELRGAVGEKSAELARAARGVDPTLKGSVEAARNTAFHALDELEKKIVQAVKRQDEIALDQLRKARVHLYPEGARQERRLNVFYYLVRYGDAFLPAVADRCSVDPVEATT